MVQALKTYRKSQFRREMYPQPASADGINMELRFQPGDTLYVTERFRLRRNGAALDEAVCCTDLAFAADFPYNDPAYALLIGWHHASQMGRHLSRLTLLVEDVRIQRVQDITDADCFAEGVVAEHRTLDGPPVYLVPGSDIEAASPREAYARFWQQLGGDWNASAWVYAVTFKTVHENVNVLLHGG